MSKQGRVAHADSLTRRRAQSPFSAQTLPAICSSPPAAHNAQARLRFFKLLKVMRVLVGTISLLRLTSSFIYLVEEVSHINPGIDSTGTHSDRPPAQDHAGQGSIPQAPLHPNMLG